MLRQLRQPTQAWRELQQPTEDAQKIVSLKPGPLGKPRRGPRLPFKLGRLFWEEGQVQPPAVSGGSSELEDLEQDANVMALIEEWARQEELRECDTQRS